MTKITLSWMNKIREGYNFHELFEYGLKEEKRISEEFKSIRKKSEKKQKKELDETESKWGKGTFC